MIPVQDAIRTIVQETIKAATAENTSSDEEAFVEETELQNFIEFQTSTDNELPSISTLIGRVLAQNVYIHVGYPPYNASIMDGYAIPYNDSDETSNDEYITYPIHSTKITAGCNTIIDVDDVSTNGDNDDDDDDVFSVMENEANTVEEATDIFDSSTNTKEYAYYITTGSVVPNHCTHVIPIEQVEKLATSSLRIRKSTLLCQPKNHWIRPAGCDIPQQHEDPVLSHGDILTESCIGLLLQCYYMNTTTILKLRRLVSVGIVSTGNELLSTPFGRNSKIGMIPDVNRPMLLSMTRSFIPKVNVIDLGQVSDTASDTDTTSTISNINTALQNVLQSELAKQCSVIVTSGGVSMGTHDTVTSTILNTNQNSTLHFDRMYMKPGKPTTFCTIRHTTIDNNKLPKRQLLLSVPGNPVSAIVCTRLLLQPCLQLLSTIPPNNNDSAHELLLENYAKLPREQYVQLNHDIVLDQGRPEYHRVHIVYNNSNTVYVESTGVQRSSRIRSFQYADGVVVLPRGTPTHPVAKKHDTAFLFLALFENTPLHVPMHQSFHMNITTTDQQQQVVTADVPLQPQQILRIGILQVELLGQQQLSDTVSKIQQRIESVMGKHASIASNRICHSGKTIQDELNNDIGSESSANKENSPSIDVYIVVSCCCNYNNNNSNSINTGVTTDAMAGTFRLHTQMVSTMRAQLLQKPSKSMSLQAQRGAINQDARSCMYETLVGQYHGTTTMLLVVPNIGLEGSLTNIRTVLRHGILKHR